MELTRGISRPSYRDPGTLLFRGDKGKLRVSAWGMFAVLVALYPVYASVSPWLGVGFFLSFLVLAELVIGLRHRVPLLQLMLLYYSLVFFLASVPLQLLRPASHWFRIDAASYPGYLAYGVPCCMAVYLGVAAATHRLPSIPFRAAAASSNPPPWAQYAMTFVWLGVVCQFAEIPLRTISPGLASPVYLLAGLRWVGVFTLLLSGQKAWRICGALVMGADLLVALWAAMFIDLILRIACAFLFVGYCFRWRAKAIVALLAALAGLLLLQTVKSDYRKYLRSSGDLAALPGSSAASHASTLANLLAERVQKPDAWLTEGSYLAGILARFDMAGVVNRVMARVPAREPHAGGATILDDLAAVMLPRLIAPDKAQAGGRELFLKYTGLRLNPSTSMSISTVSEMYVNFGPYLGVLAMLLYGLGVGGLYRLLARKSAENPVWWAWGPFVGLWAIKADEDFMNVANWTVKSLLLMAMVVWMARGLAMNPRSRSA